MVTGVIGAAIAIYKTAILNERKKRSSELQYLLAGISHTALSKSQAWTNQINLLPQPNNDCELAILRAHTRAKDDLTEIHNLAAALEGVIDSDSSAISSLLKKIAVDSETNNKIQEIALNNPTNKSN